MIVEIRDMPNQNIKSVDIHIDFQNSENNHTSVNFSKKNEKSVDVSEKILENGHQVLAHISGKLRMNYIKILPNINKKFVSKLFIFFIFI